MSGQKSVRDSLYETPGKSARTKIRIVTIIAIIAIIAFVFWILKLFADNGQFDDTYWFFFRRMSTWKFIGSGLLGTVEAALTAGVIALVIAFLLMAGRISKFKFLNVICTVLIEFTRGVPTLLFIYFFLLVVPQLGIDLPSLFRIALPVAISASGVVAEVLRSGVNAVPKGQSEAALSLGFSETKTFTKIVFPQAFRMIIPSLISELVIVVKDTTFSYVINFPDLMQNARVLISNYDALLSVYLVTAVIYILINYALNKISVVIADKTEVKGNI